MCGRYTVVSKLQIIEKEFQVDVSEVIDRFQINPNICPGDRALVITNDKPNKLQWFQFGLTPHWAKKQMFVINARSEGDHNKGNDPRYTGTKGIITKPMFRKLIRSNRCLVIADAFVEGPYKEKLSKPYLVYKRNAKRPFAMAGIWDEWVNDQTGELTSSFAVITTASTPLMQEIKHHRSPLVLAQEEEQKWIDNDLVLSEVTEMLDPFDDVDFNAYPISSTIKSPRNKSLTSLIPTGPALRKEYDCVFYQELELQGMGGTTARKRKQNEQLGLFDEF